ncbi:MAG: 50S ribosomal protein L22 [Candidatus Melainabacteria bacterium]|nr:50S ribosomal protein L22 [Candidatus Melainabacteria bacterium]
MEALASQKYILMSPRKVRRVVDVIRGKSISEAYQILRLMPYAAAPVVLKKLIDAVHNAKQLHGLLPEHLYVSKVYADEGPVYRRFKPRAQGRIYKIKKKTTHLTIFVKKV